MGSPDPRGEQVSEIVGLKAGIDLLPVELSGGEQQRVATAHAIAGQPVILAVDGPTASLE
jgi:predicted ABC-type transport system involved in lysophospholipase L1 biosynthesis ATPase subunit